MRQAAARVSAWAGDSARLLAEALDKRIRSRATCPDRYAMTPCIPFQYVRDGCYARAHQMRRIITTRYRLLLREGVQLRAVSATTRWPCRPTSGAAAASTWWYHVAPLVRVRLKFRLPGLPRSFSIVLAMVIDPGMFDKPVLLSTWLSAQENKSCSSLAKVSAYSIQPGSAYTPGWNWPYGTGHDRPQLHTNRGDSTRVPEPHDLLNAVGWSAACRNKETPTVRTSASASDEMTVAVVHEQCAAGGRQVPANRHGSTGCRARTGTMPALCARCGRRPPAATACACDSARRTVSSSRACERTDEAAAVDSALAAAPAAIVIDAGFGVAVVTIVNVALVLQIPTRCAAASAVPMCSGVPDAAISVMLIDNPREVFHAA